MLGTLLGNKNYMWVEGGYDQTILYTYTKLSKNKQTLLKNI